MTDVDRITNTLSGVLEVTEDQVERGLDLHRRLVVVDGSCGTPEIWS